VDVFAAPPVECSSVRILDHATDVALRFEETPFAEALVGGVRVARVMHFLEIKGVRATNTGKLFISRDLHSAGQVSVIGG